MQADRVHIGFSQQLRVRAPVREVAGIATFGLDHGVLIQERACRCGVTFGADRELPGGRPKCVLSGGAVRLVTVCAINQPLIDFVVKGHGELRLHIAVALEAELGFSHFEQMPRRTRGMDPVATDAAHVALAVGRALKVCVLVAVACLAFFIHRFRGSAFGGEDQADIAILRMRFAGAVAALAGHAFAIEYLSRPAVRIVGKVLHNVFVAGRAAGCAHKVA